MQSVSEPLSYRFTRRAYWFDARGLRTQLEEIGRLLGVELSIVRKRRRLLTVTMEFAVSGPAEQVEQFRVAAKPDWSRVVVADEFQRFLG